MMLIKKNKLTIFAVIILSMFVLGCVTDTRLTDTAGSETVNTYVLMVVNSDRKPLDGVSVRLVSDDAWFENVSNSNDVTSYATKSDFGGVVRIPQDTVSNKASINVLADSGTSSVFLPNHEFVKGNKQDTIVLSKSMKLSGTIVTGEMFPNNLRLYGTDYIANVDPVTGEFEFGSIPQGEYKVIASVNENGTTVTCTEIDSIDITENIEKMIIEIGDTVDTLKHDTLDIDTLKHDTLGVDTLEHDTGEVGETDPLIYDTTGFGAKFELEDGVLVDNFDMEMNLMNYFRMSDWYITKGGTMELYFPTVRDTDTAYVPLQSSKVSDGAYDGKSVHFEFSSSGGSEYYLIMGAQVTHRSFGFTNVDTISFMAKGNGAVAIRLHGDEDGYMPKATRTVNLTPEWESYVVTSNKFRVFESEGVESDWESIRHRLYWIAFDIEDDGTEFWIDDIRLKGVKFRDLISQ